MRKQAYRKTARKELTFECDSRELTLLGTYLPWLAPFIYEFMFG